MHPPADMTHKTAEQQTPKNTDMIKKTRCCPVALLSSLTLTDPSCRSHSASLPRTPAGQ